MRKILEILTPENVFVEYELAGLGSRFAAFIIDTIIQIALLVIVIVAMVLGSITIDDVQNMESPIIAIGIIILFLIFYGYYIFFELVMNGQTPGKKAMKLRVIKQNGEPISSFDSVLRNILRIADFLPTLNFAGAVFILTTKNYKRIGDFAANTIVVKVKKDEYPSNIERMLNNSHHRELNNSAAVNIYPINNVEYNILKEFLTRKDNLGERIQVFTYHLNKYFMKKFHIEQPIYNNPNEFFEEILRVNSGI